MHFKHHNRIAYFVTVSAAALSFTVPAVAQEQDRDRTLDTVLVTTQKTEESIQDVPIAVSAFDEESLEKLQLAGGPDLVKSVPNISFTKTNYTSFNLKIRGIGADVIAQSGDAGAGIYKNDIPLSGSRFLEAEFYDVERVEVFGNNVADEEVLTGHHLGDDSSGLTTNPFLTEPQTSKFVRKPP